MMNPQMHDQREMNAFMSRYRGASPAMPMHQANLNRYPSAPSDPMVAEFRAMNLQRAQTANFEHAFQDHKNKQPVTMRQHSAPLNPQQANMPMQNMHQFAPPPMMNMGSMMMAGMPNMGGAMINMQQHHRNINVPTKNEVRNLFEGVTAPKTMPMQPQQPMQQPQPMQQQQQPMSGGGMGLSADMIEKLINSDNPKWKNSKFLKFLSKVNDGEITFKDNKVVYNKDAKQQHQQTQPMQEQQDLGASWAAEFANTDQADMQAGLENQQQFNLEQWKQSFQNGFQTGMEAKDFSDIMGPAMNMRADPIYQMQQNNPYFQQEAKDNGEAFKKGLALMEKGNLKEAIQAFEANVQHHPNHAEGWRYLGQCHADEEEERSAIAALLKCLDCDPYNLPALMMLGVSYTNDLEEARALNYLKTWLENNPDYCQLPDIQKHSRTIREYQKAYDATNSNSIAMDTTLSDQVMQMFLAANKANPKDAELHTVIGVLNHLSDNYDKAIFHFQEGAKLKPTDPYLWNKLGATQANSSRSHTAVTAYQKALALKPNYMRARTNLAIAYANQNLHDKACVHYLKALRQNPQANHVWGYLKISLSSMGRGDLLQLVNRRDVNAFDAHFKF